VSYINKCSVLDKQNKFWTEQSKSDYFFANQVIKKTEAERDLRITIHSNLKPSLHVAQIVKDAERCLAVLKTYFSISRSESVSEALQAS